MPSFIFGLNAEDPQGFDKDTYAPFNNITQGGGISNLKLLGQMDLNKWELFCTEQMRDLLLINN
jgi:hypothetical protein